MGLQEFLKRCWLEITGKDPEREAGGIYKMEQEDVGFPSHGDLTKHKITAHSPVMSEPGTEYYKDTNSQKAWALKWSPDGRPHTDPWGPYLSDAVQTPHTAGTTIVYDFTCPTGYEIRLHETYSLASRAPDTAHRHEIHRATAGGTAITGFLLTETTATEGFWPSSDEVATHSFKYTVEKIVMRAGDFLRLRISNNTVAGDTLDSIITYQQRAVL